MIELIEQTRIPIGLAYSGVHASLQSALLGEVSPAHSLEGARSEQAQQYMEKVLSAYSA
jgi:hypothetical protein